MVAIRKSLSSIIESKNGIHLSAYLPEFSNELDFRRAIQEVATIAEEYLTPVLNIDQIEDFLKPIRQMAENRSDLKDRKGSIALFRNQNTMNVISFPIAVDFSCIVANSFHIKPLLRWLQEDREFLLVGLNRNSAYLYRGNQTDFQCLESTQYPESTRDSGKDVMRWLASRIQNLAQINQPVLFFTGDKDLVATLTSELRYTNFFPEAIPGDFAESQVNEICTKISMILRFEAKVNVEEKLQEFRHAQSFNLTKSNLFQIAKAAVVGRVKKMVISDEVNIFGKLDRKTGQIKVHVADLDHEDDDLLDDIGQAVLSFGGEVIVAKQKDIPNGRPILAIFHGPDPEVSSRRVMIHNRISL